MQEKKHLYIVLTRSGMPISTLMQKMNISFYTHACISFNKELTKMYTFGTLYTLDPFHTGLKKESIYRDFYLAKPYIPVKVIEVTVNKEQYCKACLAVHYLIKHHHEFSFNTIGMLFHILRISTPRPKKFFCSEFVYTLLRDIGVVNFWKPPHYVIPDDFNGLSNANTIFEGKLISLQSQLARFHGEEAKQYLNKYEEYEENEKNEETSV